MTDDFSAGFLTGVRVIQLGDGIAGSAAADLLATLGADVMRHGATDVPRFGPVLKSPAGSVAAVEAVLDRRKRIVAGRDTIDRAAVDIVICDGADPTLEPPAGTVFVVITAQGIEHPSARRPVSEMAAQASGGLLATIEDADGKPVPAPGYVASRAVGAVSALAALHAVDRRNRDSSGRAIVVDVSAQEATLFVAALPECAHILYRCPGRAGSGRYLAPSGLFACRDGMVRITAVENHQWTGLRTALGEPAWAAGLDERQTRIEHSDLINAEVTAWTKDRLKADCAALLQANGVPSTPVNTASELLASPQFQYRGALQKARVADCEAVVLGSPWTTEAGKQTSRPRRGLAGLRVAELTHVLAGPIIGALLGAMGADVVRIEDPERLDIYRRTGPFADGVAGPERGAYFAVANHSKRSVLLDPARAVDSVAAILDASDVLIENVGTPRLGRLAVEPSARADAGQLTLRVSGFGTQGPMAGYRVYANNVQAYGGLAGLCVASDGTLARLGTVLADPLSSVIGAVVIAAWAIGPRCSTGAVVDLSMAEVVAATISEYLAAASVGGDDREGRVVRAVHLATDGRWVAVELRGEQCDSDSADFAARLVATNRADDAEFKLRGAGIEAATVRKASDLVVDKHLASRQFFPQIDHPAEDLDTARLVGLPWRFAGEGPVRLAPPPALGSSTADYLGAAEVDINA